MKKPFLLLFTILFTYTAAQAQNEPPPFGLSPLEAYSIFVEGYKNKDYTTAILYGRWLVTESPTDLEGYPAKYNAPRTMKRVIRVYEAVAEQKQDPSVKEAHLDTAVMFYDKGLKVFSDEEIDPYDWRLDKGRFLQKHSDFIEDGTKKAFSIYTKLFEENPEKFTQQADGYYIQITLQNLVSEKEKQKALDMMDQAEPYANEKTKDFFNKIRNQLFDSPEERIAFLKSQLEEDPENMELLSELFEIYSEEDMNSEADEIAQKLYELDPSYENTKRLAENAMENANYNKAIKFLREALDKTDKDRQRKNIALDLSTNYSNIDELQQARKYARMASDIDPEWGKPYLEIARIYISLVGQCTENDEMTRKDRMVYWLVLDYLDKAKTVDPNVASTVNQLYDSYTEVTPTSEHKFFMGLEEGDKVQINESVDPCYSWVNETTTVR